MPNLIVSAVSTFDNKGLKKGKKEISAFDKNVQSLGKTFAKVFGTLAVANFAKNAVNAFIESEKAAAKLRTTVSNLGLEFEQPGIEDYLKNLSLQFGIVDESLIPGFQRLLIVTKDVAQAQSLFETALNVSAGTGKDLTAVSTSLSKAYLGDNAALGRLGVGLSKAQLKSASFLEVQRTLNVNFAGQAAAAVEGYAGSMAKLTVAVDESKEAIGKGLLDAIAALSGSNDIDTFTVKMVNAAEKIGNAFRTVGDVIGLLNPNATFKMGGARLRKKDFANGNFQYGAGNPKSDLVTKQLVKARKEEYNIITKKNAIENKNVEELKKKFDLERIGITAALNSATDEETKLRLKSQLAILDNNDALAKKLLAELEAAEALKKLAEEARLAGLSLLDFGIVKVKALSNKIDTYIEDLGISVIREINARIIAMLAKFNMATPPATTGQMFTGSSGAQYTAPQVQAAVLDTRELNSRINDFLGGFATGGVQRSSSQSPMDIRVTVDAGGDRLSQAIAESIQVATRSGYSTVPAGFLV